MNENNIDDDNIDYPEDCKPSVSDRISDIRDKYDNIKSNYDKAKNFSQKMRSNKGISDVSSKSISPTTTQAGTTGATTGTAGTTTGTTGAATGTTGAATGTTGAAAGTTGAAAGTTGAAAGTTGAAAGTAGGTAGVTAVAAVAWPVVIIILVILIIVIIVLIILAMAQMNQGIEEAYGNIDEIITHREKELGVPLIKIPGDGKTGILGDDWDTILGDYISYIMHNDNMKEEDMYMSEVRGELVNDFSIITYLRKTANTEFDEYLPTIDNPENKDDVEGYKEKAEFIRRYLMAGRENFNMINWYVVNKEDRGVDGNNNGKYIKNNLGREILGDLGEYLKSDFEKSQELDTLFGDVGIHTLYFPRHDKYPLSSSASSSNSLDTYLDLVSPYLQHWATPYNLAIASYDFDFGIDMLQFGKNDIDIKLFEIEKHYRNNSVTYDKYGNIVGKEYGNVNKNKNSEFVPKVEYAETLYNIIESKHVVIPADPNKDEPTETIITNVIEFKDGGRIEEYTEFWVDKVEPIETNNYTYKLSYLCDDKNSPKYDYNKEGNRKNGDLVTRTDWIMDSGKGEYEMFPSKDTERTLKWFNKLYNNEPDFDDYTGIPKTFSSNDELKKYIQKKYVSLSEEEKIKYEKKLIESGENINVVTPFSFTELYLAYNNIDKYYEYLELNTDDFFSESELDISGIPEDGFAWPSLPEATRVSSWFGWRDLDNLSSNGKENKHTGLDITNIDKSNTSVPIYAAHSGIVVKTTFGSYNSYGQNSSESNGWGYGTRVEIKTNDGKYTTMYAHLKAGSLRLKVGDTVEKGQQVGIMGNTGNSQATHLHFEVKNSSGVKINPALFYTFNGIYYSGSVGGTYTGDKKEENVEPAPLPGGGTVELN